MHASAALQRLFASGGWGGVGEWVGRGIVAQSAESRRATPKLKYECEWRRGRPPPQVQAISWEEQE